MAQKYDGVIEAVHYAPDGRLEWVRAYERRGPAFSDRVLLDRATLLARLKKGKKYLVGARLAHMGSSFQVSTPVRVVNQAGEDFLVTRAGSRAGDDLEGIPVF
jgi:hypothetical protein